MESFKVEIEEKPYKVEGKQMKIGKFVMAKRSNGARNEVSAEAGITSEREIQSAMYEQKPLKKWAIICDPSDKALVNQFSAVFNK